MPSKSTIATLIAALTAAALFEFVVKPKLKEVFPNAS